MNNGIHTDHNGNPSWQRVLSSVTIVTILGVYVYTNIASKKHEDFLFYEFLTIGCLLFAKMITKMIELKSNKPSTSDVKNE